MNVPNHERYLQEFLKVQSALRGYVLAAIRDPNEMDDIIQEIATRMWERFGDYDESRPFAAWAMGFARLQILKRKQRLARSRELFSEEVVKLLADTAAECAEEIDDRRSYLRLCMRKLDKNVRRILKMRYEESLTISQIAGRLKRSVKALEVLLVRIRKSLRSCIQREVADANARGAGR